MQVGQNSFQVSTNPNTFTEETFPFIPLEITQAPVDTFVARIMFT